MHYSEVFVDRQEAMDFLNWYKAAGGDPKPLRQDPVEGVNSEYLRNSAGAYALGYGHHMLKLFMQSSSSDGYKKRIAQRVLTRLTEGAADAETTRTNVR